MPRSVFVFQLKLRGGFFKGVFKWKGFLGLARIYGSKPDVMKSAYADLTCLYVEAARFNLDAENLATFLHSVKIFGTRADKICEFYGKHRDCIVGELAQIGDGLPCVVDVDWRLDHCVKVHEYYTVFFMSL